MKDEHLKLMMEKGIEYRRKIKSGEIPKPILLNPKDKALKYPKSLKAAILAKCYECLYDYADGRYSCEMPDCPLYNWMPYKNKHRSIETNGEIN